MSGQFEGQCVGQIDKCGHSNNFGPRASPSGPWTVPTFLAESNNSGQYCRQKLVQYRYESFGGRRRRETHLPSLEGRAGRLEPHGTGGKN